MGYVAIKGGGQAIAGSKAAFDFLRARQSPQQTSQTAQPLDTGSIENQLRLLHSRVISEGGLYHPKLASLAIKQAQGDTLEAAFILRAHRSTVPRLAETEAMDTTSMRITRRISSAFKDIPGGQMLGATTDYHLRLMRMELLNESPEHFKSITENWFQNSTTEGIPDSFPKVLDALRKEGLLPTLSSALHNASYNTSHSNESIQKPFDITRQPLIFPVPRSAALSTLTRGEQGSLLAIAYSNMRGYGDIHPTIAELRVGYLPVMLPHPITGKPMEVGEIEITECEIVAMYQADDKDSKPCFSLGYGACFGHNEVKAISMAILDRSLQLGAQQDPANGPLNPSADAEFVLMHVDGVDSMGFCSHYKMPHYVTFQSDMDRLRATQAKQARNSGAKS